MTREEAKDFLFDMFNLIGTTAIEHWTEKDAEKMRQAVLVIENESTQPELPEPEELVFVQKHEKIPVELRVSAQPERKTGYWHITDAYPHNVYCSECHKKYAQTHWTVWEDGSLPRNFCPNCGAYMKGEEEE